MTATALRARTARRRITARLVNPGPTFADLTDPGEEDLSFNDLFCGAGGSSIGLTAAGFRLKLGANHWERAIETHGANFGRWADHWCADVSQKDLRMLPHARVLWASPICTELSPAGGNGQGQGKNKSKTGSKHQLALDDQHDEAHGPVSPEAYVRTRTTFYDVLRAVEVWRYDAVLIENVVEAAWKWELFEWWVTAMQRLGYNFQFVSVSSAHVGGPALPSAPQWRDRLYIVFTRKGIPLPDLEPRPRAYCPECRSDVDPVQWFKPGTRKYLGRPVGKYRSQYLYRCPNSSCQHAVVEPYVRPAAAILDFTNLGEQIGAREKPLADDTMRRIAAGAELFWPTEMFTVPAGGTWRDDPASVAEPMGARTTRDTDGLVSPVVMNVNHHGDDGRPRPADAAPLAPRTTKVGDGVLSPPPFLATLRANSNPELPDMPIPTVAAGGNHTGLVTPADAPSGAFVTRHFTPRGDGAGWSGLSKDVRHPLGAITSSDHHSLVIPYRNKEKARPAGQPLHTVHTKESAGLLRPGDWEFDVLAAYFRMLTYEEHFLAQTFPEHYQAYGNKGELTKQAGNAVSCNVAHWVGLRLKQVLT
jgi:DNA (cytosine-5)-methyltransferase 1